MAPTHGPTGLSKNAPVAVYASPLFVSLSEMYGYAHSHFLLAFSPWLSLAPAYLSPIDVVPLPLIPTYVALSRHL